MFINLDEVVGVGTKSVLEAIWNPKTNKWDVKNVITQSRKKKDSDWEEKHIETKSSREKLEDAMSDIFLTTEFYFNSVKGDMFSEQDTPELSD